MEFHRLKATELESFCKKPGEARDLLLVSLASFYSNLELFGGEDSESCKIKKKHLEKRGAQVCQKIFLDV